MVSKLNTKQLSQLLGVHPKTIHRWVKAGKLTAGKTPGGHYRFTRDQAEELLGDRLTPRARSIAMHVMVARQKLRYRRQGR